MHKPLRPAFHLDWPQVRDFKFGAVFKVCIISFETMRKFSKDLKGHCDILICDEGHRCTLSCCCFGGLSLRMPFPRPCSCIPPTAKTFPAACSSALCGLGACVSGLCMSTAFDS